MTTMNALANELIEAIGHHVARADLPAFRLASRRLAQIGAKQLFSSVHLMFVRSSFENLLRIAEHPVYNKYVTAIEYEAFMIRDYSTSDLDDPDCRRLWEVDVESCHPSGICYYQSRAHEGIGIDSFPEDWLDRGFDAYNNMWKDRVYMEETGFDFASIRSAISRFPNLTEFRVLSKPCNTEVAYPSAIVDAAYSATLLIPSDIDADIEDEFSGGTRHLTTILVAVALTGTHLSALSCDVLSIDFFNDSFGSSAPDYCQLSHAAAGPPPASLANYALDVFRHLKHINLTLFPECEWKPPIQAKLGGLLRAAEGLETLSIRHEEGSLSWEALIGDATWPRLEFMEGDGFSVEARVVSAFVRRHTAASLLRMELSTLVVNVREWERGRDDVAPYWVWTEFQDRDAAAKGHRARMWNSSPEAYITVHGARPS